MQARDYKHSQSGASEKPRRGPNQAFNMIIFGGLALPTSPQHFRAHRLRARKALAGRGPQV